MDLQFGNNNKICGPCHLTVDKSKIKSADAVIINNSELMLWQKVRNLQDQTRTLRGLNLTDDAKNNCFVN